jgi:YHS domain-containing protein
MSNATIVKDPVCGMRVDLATARHTSEYRGQRYAFCSPGCKRQFDADPERYLGTAAPAGCSCCRS